ncbi:hypothetical protein OHT61_24110 [Streptomyces sp. NBC_00178]|uniref:DUF6197 family protein n=1 Tax=Streptomyces sp. NBC_00178 TaxID=2975672 RepID=UPI002E2B2866|nr:hypothetical protein [Streptomyces sp. NBC_00178]
MDTAQLTPDQLDAQASRLHDTDAWQRIVMGWEVTTPEAVSPASELTGQPRTSGHGLPGADAACALSEAEAAREVPVAAPGAPTTTRVHPKAACAVPVGAHAVLEAEAAHTVSGAVRVAPVHTRPAPVPHGAPHDGARPARPVEWRNLLSVPVEQLIEESLRTLPAPVTPSAGERRLPGRVGAVLPDRLHAWRRIGQPDVRPSSHLGHARQILTEWGWQNTPYRLRNARGARCVCGAMLTAHRLGYGSLRTVDRAGAWMITELRSQGWTDLIGPWNRHPGRTVDDALALIDATIRRASLAGE